MACRRRGSRWMDAAQSIDLGAGAVVRCRCAAGTARPKGVSMSRHRVVIIGSGFGGLNAAKALRRADVDITLISKTTTHLFQPLLYQVATGILSEGDIAP